MIGLIKASNEGTNSPFIARMFAGVLEIRNNSILGNSNPLNRKIDQNAFDQFYDPIFKALQTTLQSARNIIFIVENHTREINDGKIVQFQEGSYSIQKSVDQVLNEEIGKLIDNGLIAVKDPLQEFLKQIYELDIGFLYQQDKCFVIGINNLRSKHLDSLANYLELVRTTWLSKFQLLRNMRQHKGGWTLAPARYHLEPPKTIIVTFPEVEGLPLTSFAKQTANRIIIFVENIIAYAFKFSNRGPYYLVEIPFEQRESSNPKRFKVVPKGLCSELEWDILFQDIQDFI